MPATQTLQLLAPELENFPASQLIQNGALTPEYLPPSHTKHSNDPDSEYLPAMQWIQEEAPAPEYEPAEQIIHSNEAVKEYFPAIQTEQEETSEAVEELKYVPAIHAVFTPLAHQYPAPQSTLQTELVPDRDHFPSAQFKQVEIEEAPVVDEYFPGKHDIHVEINDAVVAVEYVPAKHALFTPPVQ